jgi:hypothetical protein
MSKKPRSPDELKKASEALYYEILMLNACAETYYECLKNKILFSQFTQNILIESFCVHTRSLLEFFCAPNPLENDIFYKDFNPSAGFTPSFAINLKVTKDNLDVCLAHLSYERINKKINWEMYKITNEINKNMQDFLKSVNQSLICDKLKNYFKAETKETEDNFTCSTSDMVLPGITVTAYRGPTIFRRTDKK